MGFGIGVEQQLVRIETMPFFRCIGSMDTVAVHRPRLQVGHENVPYLIGIFGQFDTLDFLATGCVEQAQFDLGGMRRKQREIHADAVPRRAQRKRDAFGDACGVTGMRSLGGLA
jgi:hypothetical protein